ncbi:MAG: DUF4858 domain-containing protein [Bacteroidia bacterium]|nr:DUF4858 domain-containing protein [Bacteroidia bacterium]
MTKRLLLWGSLTCFSLLVRAQQWSVQDSLNLKRLLDGSEKLQLNKESIRQIDFGHNPMKQKLSAEKEWLLPDETLPTALPKAKVTLTLHPYTAQTRYDWDPIYQRQIHVTHRTWQESSSAGRWAELNPTNWKEKLRKGEVNFRLLSERANGMSVSVPVMNVGRNLSLGHGVYINGGVIGGLDLMLPFTKDFWDVKGRERRERTLELLKTYGDSTTVLINRPIISITR